MTIKDVTTIIPTVEIFHCGHDAKAVIEGYKEETARTWSYLPSFGGFSNDLEHCNSHYTPLSPVLTAVADRLLEMKEAFYEMNEIVENCLNSYSLYHETFYLRDSGPQFIWIEKNGNQFSGTLDPPTNSYTTAAMFALSDVTIRLEAHDIEYDMFAGDVLILPCLFPFDLRARSVNDEAFLYFKYMWPV
ncbi:MAG: hypothetical protein HOJ16_06485 [Candidatus Peribacter sp.]|jgi:hypothetical protein|nr:hypothetical protein [Candidatus Peribacter sp.]